MAHNTSTVDEFVKVFPLGTKAKDLPNLEIEEVWYVPFTGSLVNAQHAEARGIEAGYYVVYRPFTCISVRALGAINT